MARLYNFCAGPAALPEPVLERAAAEMLEWGDTGASVMELSHRSDAVVAMVQAAEASLRRLLGITDDYAVLFLQGGASLQFAAVPLNLAGPADRVAYVNTGQWSEKAIAEATRYAAVTVVASSEASRFTRVPPEAEWDAYGDAAYLHYCANETIGGVAFPFIPETVVPLVADMSSTLLSQPLDVSRFGVIYAGAQKNIGPAGLTLVIVRRDLLGRAQTSCPTLMDWAAMAAADSMLNTPPTYAIYLAGLVFAWLEAGGGLAAMAAINRRKADMLYAAIDTSDFYANPVMPACRSLMNVPFTLADPALDALFLDEAEAAGLLNLKGHRAVGGMRASIYNAVSEEAVTALCAFMADFEQRRA